MCKIGLEKNNVCCVAKKVFGLRRFVAVVGGVVMVVVGLGVVNAAAVVVIVGVLMYQ